MTDAANGWFKRRFKMNWRSAVAVIVALVGLAAPIAAPAADEPDLIFRRSTVFKWLSPNDKLATYGLDDPEIEGVANVVDEFCLPCKNNNTTS